MRQRDRESPNATDGDASSPASVTVLAASTAYQAVVFCTIGAVGLAVVRPGWSTAVLVVVLLIVGFGVDVVSDGLVGVWSRQTEGARPLAAAVVERPLRTMGRSLAVGVVVASVVALCGLLFGDLAISFVVLLGMSGGHTHGAQVFARWERESGRRLVCVPGRPSFGRRPPFAVPAAAVVPAGRAAHA